MTSIECDITEQISISNRLSHDDIPALVKYLNNPTLIANTLKIPSPYTTNDGAEFIDEIKATPSKSVYLFTIRSKENDEMIGACGFHRSQENERRAEIGYWLAEPYWYQGLMVKVLNKSIEIIQGQWHNLVRLEARIFPWNKASMRVVEKCGFQFEGIRRKSLYKNGKDIDEHCFGLILQ